MVSVILYHVIKGGNRQMLTLETIGVPSVILYYVIKGGNRQMLYIGNHWCAIRFCIWVYVIFDL